MAGPSRSRALHHRPNRRRLAHRRAPPARRRRDRGQARARARRRGHRGSGRQRPLGRVELARFRDMTRALKERVGADGKPAFQIPVEQSSRDAALVALDRESMRSWLDRNAFSTPFVRWYVRYALLDDFGGEPEDVSAWA